MNVVMEPDRDIEKADASKASSVNGLPSSHPDSKVESPSRQFSDVQQRTFFESEIFDHVRTRPDEDTPIYLTFSPTDKDNPRNWNKLRKWYITCFVSMLNVLTCLCAGGISSGYSGIEETFHVSAEIATLALCMYVLGFAIGPLMLAPLSEYYGRNPAYIWSWLLLVIFQIPVPLAPNIGTIIVCRLIQGFFGSAPLTNTGGTVSDLWTRNECGYAMAVYGVSSTAGPPLALVISGYVALEKGWRWLSWVFMAITGGFWIIMILTLPETRHSIILQNKTKRVRKQLEKESITTASRVRDAHADERKGLHQLFAITLTRPFRFLFSEPITFFSAIYNGFIYGLVYIFNEAFPLVFGAGGHNFNGGEQGLVFLGLAIGSIVAAFFHPLQEKYYLKRVAKNDGKGVPEARMFSAMGGAFLLPISLFWFGWTSYPSVHWIVPIIASASFGAGIYIVILGILNYVVDSYQTYSASALAGVILVRNLVGAGFPLFATQMYQRLGNEWASSLLAFLSILLIPIPFLFFFKGEAIRLKSPWAREHFEQDEDAPH